MPYSFLVLVSILSLKAEVTSVVINYLNLCIKSCLICRRIFLTDAKDICSVFKKKKLLCSLLIYLHSTRLLFLENHGLLSTIVGRCVLSAYEITINSLPNCFKFCIPLVTNERTQEYNSSYFL